jgi:hypothetical protein
MVEPNPEPKGPELRRVPDAAREKLGRDALRRGPLGRVEAGARGKAYTEKPQFGDARTVQSDDGKKRRSGWLVIAMAAIALGISGLIWKQESLQQSLILTAADIDYAATAAARASLARGEIPPVLAQADAETRRKILSGEENLYTKRLLNENQQRGILVHARVSAGGTFLGEDILTAERPQGTTFPAGPGAPTHFHSTVEQAGPNGAVSCYVNSVNGHAVSTRPLAAGESADLEVITR